MFPDELKGLTPVEEKLIALNLCYGFITKYSLPEGRRQSARYPKHVKGHITVFPNNIQDLVSNVLPHPLVKVMGEIHVFWQGPEKPAPGDLSAILSVRRRVVERALVWLKRNNPLYAKIHIDTAEMDTWEAPPHGVPFQIYARLERNKPSAWEKARTGQVVPPTERGLEAGEPRDVREVLAALKLGIDIGGGGEACVGGGANSKGENGGEEAVVKPERAVAAIHEISSSGMFALDVGPDVADAEKLRMLSVTRRNFADVERLVWSLSPKGLEKAKAKLEASGKTVDEGVKQLLRCLSLYGFRQLMSRESRLSMRRKILSLIIRYGIPAIWFTLSPNDLTNPVR
ncbi:hypothetical protein GGTG_13291 [Gaeumannomyces tritici R3-111a-1]|uniref:Uncharacterized protein n=1 Tax=Gaeumannomyces tritici (strain R3-111a-1) TaxID=644352 RepID=J3PIG3_GAET3|nr:hypothetical protein GGTG_13291 [Gaeumannomyces tritici R3-111a-1]EJT69182.1 hypothetical protein GGTG_13291 [Gaeumannomyces tritici R3-111a-1]